MGEPVSPPVRLEVRQLTKHFALRGGTGRSKAVVHAVDDVSLNVPAGETLAIVGESGCGKSTLARCIVGLTAPTSGAVLLDGVNISEREAMRQHRRDVQLVSQNALSALNRRRTVGSAIAQAMHVHGLGQSKRERLAAAEDLLQRVGLRRDYRDRFPFEMSGGEMQRAAIARALAVEPSVLVLDEPTSSLDVSVKAKIVNLLLELQQELGLTYVIITHEIDLALHVADRVAIMYLGRLTEDASVEQAAAGAIHPYARLLLAAKPAPDPRVRAEYVGITGEVPSAVDPPSGCRFHTRCPIAIDQCAASKPELVDLGDGQLVACHLAQPRTVEKGPVDGVERHHARGVSA
jgi:oligopeptide/dipeptide ABC transporter ATP-binding protein